MFLNTAKHGTAVDTAARDAAVAASLLLQHGCSAEKLRRALMRNGDGSASGPLAHVLDLLATGVRELKRRPDLGIGELHDWHEIKLEIAKPRYLDDGEPHSDIITGRWALHFCRKHIRVYHSGVLTYVTGHWRGDPTIGLRRGRYAVAADKQTS
jgi:hypothetical protein